MAIHRSARKQSNFTIIDNVVFTSGLSFRAMGLLSYLLSKPDHWSVSVTQLVRCVADSDKPDGRDAVYAMLKELIKAGFVQRKSIRDESGKMAGSDYIVFDQPMPVTPEPLTDKPHTDEPLAAEPTLVSTEVLGSTDAIENTDKPLCIEDAFEVFWSAGMAKINKKKARSIFNRIAGKDPLAFAKQLRDDVQARLAAGQLGFDAMHPTTYLNGERWNDEIKQPTASKPNARLTPMEEFEQAIRERDAQSQGGGLGMEQDDRALWGSVDTGERQSTDIDLDSSHWETKRG